MADDDRDHRIERDTMGEVRVPADAKYRAQTQRAVENFPVSGLTLHPLLIRALAGIKGAAARANAARGIISAEMADAIAAAADEIVDEERWTDQFPIDVFQTGSGTSTNMNMNEVLATLASERLGGEEVHPNDHVNASQSSNDVFPSAIHVAAAGSATHSLLPALERLREAFAAKSEELAHVVKAGRTHLMDATPVTLGQEMGAYARTCELGVERLRSVLPRVGELPLGGTATGTGLNAPEGFAADVIAAVGERWDVELIEAADHFEAHGQRDSLVELSGVLRTIAVGLYKCANDLRWMNSGPRTGLAEIRLPELQPGSSIMPGKVNPVIPEAMCQVTAQVIGNDAAVAFAGSAGTFELNVMLPVMARNLLESLVMLTGAVDILAEKCVAGIEADEERCRTYAEASPAVATALNPVIGYEQAAEVVKESVRSGRSIREVLVERDLVPEEDLDDVLDVLALTRGGVPESG